jgi:hypothetical protein
MIGLPPLQGKQPTRCVAFRITKEQHDGLLAEQKRRADTPSISALCREAFERGLRP